jgi:anthranilate synthase component 2
VVFVDNQDSFVFNLVDEFARRGATVETWRNDTPITDLLARVEAAPAARLVVLSPGPGRPETAGECLPLLGELTNEPVFGVCLGMQAIVTACGGSVDRTPEIVHGRASVIDHDERGLFAGCSTPMTVIPMAVEHRERPWFGVQFHPESILTSEGGRLIDNVMTWADAC